MITLVIWVLIAYGFTSILVWGSIFEKARVFIKKHSKFFGDLISCTLCTSTWVGFFMSITIGHISKMISINDELPWFMWVFFDGMLTAGAVWIINSIVEFFEESRIK